MPSGSGELELLPPMLWLVVLLLLALPLLALPLDLLDVVVSRIVGGDVAVVLL